MNQSFLQHDELIRRTAKLTKMLPTASLVAVTQNRSSFDLYAANFTHVPNGYCQILLKNYIYLHWRFHRQTMGKIQFQ